MAATLEHTRIDEVTEMLQEIRAQLALLQARIVKLEAEGISPPRSGPQPVPAATAPVPLSPALPVDEEVSEEIMLVIAAAVAAYLGERAHIRVVRLAPSGAWAQQGRVSIQASHRLN